MPTSAAGKSTNWQAGMDYYNWRATSPTSGASNFRLPEQIKSYLQMVSDCFDPIGESQIKATSASVTATGSLGLTTRRTHSTTLHLNLRSWPLSSCWGNTVLVFWQTELVDPQLPCSWRKYAWPKCGVGACVLQSSSATWAVDHSSQKDHMEPNRHYSDGC